MIICLRRLRSPLLADCELNGTAQSESGEVLLSGPKWPLTCVAAFVPLRPRLCDKSIYAFSYLIRQRQMPWLGV